VQATLNQKKARFYEMPPGFSRSAIWYLSINCSWWQPTKSACEIRYEDLISQADFVGCHQLQFIDKYQMAERLKPGGIFLLNTDPQMGDGQAARLLRVIDKVPLGEPRGGIADDFDISRFVLRI
jgi:hypothetical protein